MKNEKKITTGAAAEKLGVSERRVRKLIEEGRLPAEKFGRDYIILEKDLILLGNRKPGRPRADAVPPKGDGGLFDADDDFELGDVSPRKDQRVKPDKFPPRGYGDEDISEMRRLAQARLDAEKVETDNSKVLAQISERLDQMAADIADIVKMLREQKNPPN